MMGSENVACEQTLLCLYHVATSEFGVVAPYNGPMKYSGPMKKGGPALRSTLIRHRMNTEGCAHEVSEADPLPRPR